MGFSVGTYAKVWNVEDKGRYSVVELSVSKKAKDENGNEIKGADGKSVYNIEFSSKFVRFVGKAHELAKTLQKNDSIKILNCDVTNKYDKEKNTTFTNYVVFDAEASQYNNSNRGNGKSQKTSDNRSGNDGFMNIPDDVGDEGLPFN